MIKKQSLVWNKLYSGKLEWHYETKVPEGINLKRKKVLEIGVGTGKTLKGLIGRGAKKIVAIDNSKEAVKRAKSKIKEKSVKVIHADVRDMPFEDKEFDVIICYYVLNNMLAEERVEAVEEIIRVLNDKGMILFEDFAVGDFRQKGKEVEKNSYVKENGLLCHFFSEEEIRNLFEGFKMETKVKEFKPFRALDYKRKIINAVIST
jgi:ubiquinone/menaquinone biosynthesis C-methylase UbiE